MAKHPAFQRMKRRGWIRSAWRVTPNNRRARYYELTSEGEAQLAHEHDAWRRSATAVEKILQASV